MYAASFRGGLIFALFAAFGLPGAWLLLGPSVGADDAVALYLVFVALAYVGGIAPGAREALVGVLALFPFSLLLLAVAAGPGEVAVGVAVLVALARSVLFYRAKWLRALCAELFLTLGGLALALFTAGPGPARVALGVWSFFLVQSLFFGVAGVEPRAPTESSEDPFDLARSQLLSLLEDDGVGR